MASARYKDMLLLLVPLLMIVCSGCAPRHRRVGGKEESLVHHNYETLVALINYIMELKKLFKFFQHPLFKYVVKIA